MVLASIGNWQQALLATAMYRTGTSGELLTAVHTMTAMTAVH